MMKIKLFTMQRNEDDILREWIAYHSRIFGASNIHIIDHLSLKSVATISEMFPDVNLRLFNKQNNQLGILQHGVELTKWMMEEKDNCDIMIPLDLDEFISYDGILVDKEKILSELANLARLNEEAYRFNVYSYRHSGTKDDALLSKTGVYYSKNIRKVFFSSKQFIKTKNGNHGKHIEHDIPFCNLSLLHYPVRSYEQYLSKYLNAPEKSCTVWRQQGELLRSAKTHEERLEIYNSFLRSFLGSKQRNVDVSDFIREIKDIREKNYE